MTLSARIIEACTGKPDGMRFREITDLLHDEKYTVVAVMIGQCAKAGGIAKVGPRGHSRYFSDPELAAARVQRALNVEHLRDHRLALQRARRRRQAEAREAGMSPEAAAKAVKERKRLEVQASRKRVVKIVAAPAKPTNIIWPEHVKVLVHPTPLGRFDFEPPKGWVGQISKDQMDRRMQSCGGVV